jgi:protease I
LSSIPERLRKQEKVIIITADNTEDIEFFYPYYRLTEEGYAVDVVTPKGGKFAGKHGLGLNKSVAINDVNPADYALLYIPGGKAPAELRKNDAVISFVKQFAAAGKPIAAICHGPQVLVSADLVRGRQLAAWPEVAKEIEEAGGTFVDEALVEDGTSTAYCSTSKARSPTSRAMSVSRIRAIAPPRLPPRPPPLEEGYLKDGCVSLTQSRQRSRLSRNA